MLHSPLACRLSRSQSGKKSRSASFHGRVTVVLTFAGLPTVLDASTYLPALTFSAVRPVPNRS